MNSKYQNNPTLEAGTKNNSEENHIAIIPKNTPDDNISKTKSLSNSKVDIEKKPTYLSHEKFQDADAGDGTTRADQILHGTPLYFCVFSSLLCFFLVALDQMIVATAITRISNEFEGFEKITWIFAAFLVSMGSTAQVWGRISIIFGRKWTLVTGVIIFEIGSLICAVSQSMDMLIFGRAIQGVGGACIQSVSVMICAEVVTIDKRSNVISGIGVVYSFASVFGPILGGVFTQFASWRWCFWINLCFGAVIFPLFCFSFNPKSPQGTIFEKFRKVDYIGSVLMIAASVLPLVAMSLGVSKNKWSSSGVICCFVFGGLSIICFLIWNLKFSKYPVLLPSICKTPLIHTAVGLGAFGYTAFTVGIQFIVVYFQVVEGQNAIQSGLMLLPFFIPVCIFTMVGGALVTRTRQVKLVGILSGIFLVIGYGLLLLLNENTSFSKKVGLLFFSGIGAGLSSQPPFLSVQILAPKDPGGMILSNAYMSFGRSMMISFFSIFGQVIYTETLRSNLRKVEVLSLAPGQDLMALVSDTSLLSKLSSKDRDAVRHAVMESVKNDFYMLLACACMALFCSLLMSNTKLPRKKDVEQHSKEKVNANDKEIYEGSNDNQTQE
ncbi:unnamed protein product [Ambrosiozyma monospora]|uniref:Unnamed protein product n=1 Tax=Ambrosiozyma monospora TaxID=43982 RepID=A0ACB5T2J9_AMBMO|nr:unnamed protein product [Ambrosiozyma monospora]